MRHLNNSAIGIGGSLTASPTGSPETVVRLAPTERRIWISRIRYRAVLSGAQGVRSSPWLEGALVPPSTNPQMITFLSIIVCIRLGGHLIA
jgi:hypothetical protein